jgi:hypothetical protein
MISLDKKYLKYILAGLLAVVLGAIVYENVQSSSYKRTIAQLQNDVATRDKTIEVSKGVYERLVLESRNIQGLLDKTDAQVDSLTKELQRRGEELLVAQRLSLSWKQKYEARGSATQTTVPGLPGPSSTPDRTKVAFEKDFGYIGVEGYTLTSPPEFWVSIHNKRPLRLTLTIGRIKDGSWKADVVSSEDNVGVDIVVAAVDTSGVAPAWYSKVGVGFDFGVGSDKGLGGVGISYRFGTFDVGPKVWVSVGGGVGVVYGASIVWHPFAANQ